MRADLGKGKASSGKFEFLKLHYSKQKNYRKYASPENSNIPLPLSPTPPPPGENNFGSDADSSFFPLYRLILVIFID